MITDPQTNTQTDRGDYNTLHRSFASAECNNNNNNTDIYKAHSVNIKG